MLLPFSVSTLLLPKMPVSFPFKPSNASPKEVTLTFSSNSTKYFKVSPSIAILFAASKMPLLSEEVFSAAGAVLSDRVQVNPPIKGRAV